jgi:TonB family protein
MLSNKFLNIFLLLFLTITISAQKGMDWKVPPYEVEEISIYDTPFPRFLEDDEGLKIEYVLVGLPDSLQKEIKKVSIEEEKPKVYPATDLDGMPLFDESCANAENPMTCSLEKATEFFQKNLDYPEDALDNRQEGLVKLIFVINEDGWVEDKIKVLKREKPCADCGKAAVEAAYNMPAWLPAKANGQKVKAMVILPIRFETEVLYDDQ